MDIENYYKIILLGDRCTQVEVVCPRPLCSGVQLGLEPTTCELQVWCRRNGATTHPDIYYMFWEKLIV